MTSDDYTQLGILNICTAYHKNNNFCCVLSTDVVVIISVVSTGPIPIFVFRDPYG